MIFSFFPQIAICQNKKPFQTLVYKSIQKKEQTVICSCMSKKGFTKKLGLGVYGDFFFDFGEVACAEAAFKKFF